MPLIQFSSCCWMRRASSYAQIGLLSNLSAKFLQGKGVLPFISLSADGKFVPVKLFVLYVGIR